MKAALILTTACLALAACSTTATTPAEPEYLRVPAPPLSEETALDTVTSIIGVYPESTEGGPTLDLQFRPLAGNSSRLEMIGIAGPLLDDSARFFGWRAEVVQTESGMWRVVELGVRYKCWRAEDPDEWRAALCP